MAEEYCSREHETSEDCWCEPIVIFAFTENYGKVILHRDFGKNKEIPNAETILLAVIKALYEHEDVFMIHDKEGNHVKDD